MIRIGYDAKRAFLNFSGLGNYSRSLIDIMSSFYSSEDYFLYTPKTGDTSSKGRMFDFLHRHNVEVCTPSGISAAFPALWRSALMGKDIAKDRIDLFHGLSGELPENLKGVKSIVTIHDLIFMRYPEYYRPVDRRIYRQKFHSACVRADRILAISHQTAEDLVRFFHIDPRRIEIVYQGCDRIFSSEIPDAKVAEVRRRYALPEHYIVNIGTIEKRKNLSSVIRAVKSLPEQYHLVAVGRPTVYMKELRAVIEETQMQNRVHFIHDASFSDFPALYKGAVMATYVSVFEGFGIPVLEAMSSGTPIITSNLSSMPEAAGQAGILVDPMNVEEIGEAMSTIVHSPTIRKKYIEKGYIQAAEFSDEKISGNIYNLYQTVLK